MREGIVWLLTRAAVYGSGARSEREHVGVFTLPERAFQVMRDHPDFQDVQLVWHPEPWDFEVDAYFSYARTRFEGDGHHWDLSLVPLRLDDPVFDFREDRERYERIRESRT